MEEQAFRKVSGSHGGSWRARLSWSWLLVMAPLACADPAGPGTPPGLELRAEAANVVVGEPLPIRLVNATEHAASYHLCLLRLERRVAPARWDPVPAFPEDVVCTLALYVLSAGGTLDESFLTHAWMEPGVYRLRLDVGWPVGAGTVTLTSGGFRIVDGPLP